MTAGLILAAAQKAPEAFSLSPSYLVAIIVGGVGVLVLMRFWNKKAADAQLEQAQKTIQTLKDSNDALTERVELLEKESTSLQATVRGLEQFAAPEAFKSLRDVMQQNHEATQQALQVMAEAITNMAQMQKAPVHVDNAYGVFGTADGSDPLAKMQRQRNNAAQRKKAEGGNA